MVACIPVENVQKCQKDASIYEKKSEDATYIYTYLHTV